MQEQLLNTFDKCEEIERTARFLRMYKALGRNCLANKPDNNFVAQHGNVNLEDRYCPDHVIGLMEI